MEELRLRDLEELRTFVQVLDSGSMTAAGRVLGLPTNVVSRRIARLEERLGVPLAQRSTRKLQPTEEGRRLHLRARRILEEAAQAETELRGIGLGLSGELRLALPTLVAAAAKPALYALMDEHPTLELRMFVNDRPAEQVVRDIIEQGLDAALLVGNTPPASIVARRLAHFEPVLAASAEYLARRGRPRRLEDLHDHECLCYIGDRLQTHWVLRSASGKEELVAVHGRFASSDSRALRQAMFDGQGIGLAAAAEFASPALVRVLPKYRSAPLEVRLGYAAGRKGSHRIRALLEILRPALQQSVQGSSD